ncbi:hypothetical protein BN8_03065 [Fibrisoma limi BUZ 3]|uniref:Uncharacterized protein n=1 Tax=Fibrisoma limi BUZ 3 TaxID=1185876 RepID=I2GJ56_9BACT|nr:hypothetical protein [Fibrisoma limi]CCH53931.1 hypothetical protein BN8_03065 [Fibrisoma limi BUZ 3]
MRYPKLFMLWLLAVPTFGQLTTDTLNTTRTDGVGTQPNGPSQLRRHQLIHARVLAGWAIANVVVEGTSMFFSEGQWHHFHHMNAAWGSINLLVAGVFWHQTRQQSPFVAGPTAMQQERKFRRFLRINLGLDLLYLATGFWLKQRGAGLVDHQAMLQGFGQAIILQGVTLLSLDATSLAISLRRLKKLCRLYDSQPYPAGSDEEQGKNALRPQKTSISS